MTTNYTLIFSGSWEEIVNNYKPPKYTKTDLLWIKDLSLNRSVSHFDHSVIARVNEYRFNSHENYERYQKTYALKLLSNENVWFNESWYYEEDLEIYTDIFDELGRS